MKKSVIALSLLTIIFLVIVSGCANLSNSNYGKIIINSTPTGAEVYFNNTYKGTTPNTIESVLPGTYQFELRLKDYQTYSESINVQPNEAHHLTISLIPVIPTPLPIPITTTYQPTVTTTYQPTVTTTYQPTITTTYQPTTTLERIVPLMILSQGDQNYHSYETIHFSGIGPKGQFVSITLTGPTGVSNTRLNAAKIDTDGTWEYYYDLTKNPIAYGTTKVLATTSGQNAQSAGMTIYITA